MALYHQAWAGLRLVHAAGPDYVAHLCVARHADRDGIRRRLAEQGVSTAVHYPWLDHQQPALAGLAGEQWSCRSRNRRRPRFSHSPVLRNFAAEVDFVCEAIHVLS